MANSKWQMANSKKQKNMFRFEELQIWQLATDYAKECYKIANSFPKFENYALSDQLRRASISISNNIAEGSVGSNANFKKYLNTAIGSILETVNIINFSREIQYTTEESKMILYRKAEELIKKIRSFSKSLD